ncbi:MAG: lysophospholipid acyltransferase family protein [Myxococcota bacterium]|nr:lysophospholipid acyltransferase family protein [Myxococcota bacterium]
MAEHYLVPRQIVRRLPSLHGPGQRLESWLLQRWVRGLARMPLERATRRAGASLASIGPFTSRRDKVARNLLVAFPELTWAEHRRLVRAVFRNLGVSIAEIAQIARIWAERAQRLEFVAHPDLRFLREPGTPAVFVTAHVGAWTLTNLAAGHYGVPLTIVYAPESNPLLEPFVRGLRGALPCRLANRDGSIRTLMRELAAGRCVGLATDVRVDEGEPVPFFGHPMQTSTIPARLALRYGCELVTSRCERLPGGRFRVRIDAPLEPDPSLAPPSQVLDLTARIHARFERWIDETPGQWMCLGRRWAKDVQHAGRVRPNA